jgi:hypothetical protein
MHATPRHATHLGGALAAGPQPEERVGVQQALDQVTQLLAEVLGWSHVPGSA